MGAGEPPTDAKVRQIERAGARFVSNYGMSEAGSVGAGCPKAGGSSDYHVYTDACALFTHPHHVEAFGITVPAFNLTTLLPMSSKVMLNVESDDFGVLEERDCGCPLWDLGLRLHVSRVRSYEKLNSEGMTFLGSDVITLLEYMRDELIQRDTELKASTLLIEERERKVAQREKDVAIRGKAVDAAASLGKKRTWWKYLNR